MLHRCYKGYSTFSICQVQKSNVTVLQPIHGPKVRKNMLIIPSYFVLLEKCIARYTDVTILTVHFYMPPTKNRMLRIIKRYYEVTLRCP